MDEEIIKKMKNESLWLLILIVLSILVFKVLFYKESILVVIRTVLAITWLFVLPGFLALYYWHDKLEFTERLIAGAALSTALVAIPSYYLGLLGLNIKYHGIILPLAIIVVGVLILMRKKS